MEQTTYRIHFTLTVVEARNATKAIKCETRQLTSFAHSSYLFYIVLFDHRLGGASFWRRTDGSI